MVSAILLSAGLSNRMGGENKLLLPFLPDKNIIQTVADALINSIVDEIIVVVGHDSSNVIETLSDRAVKFITNSNYKDGMTTTIQQGVLNSNPESNGFLICLADQPYLKSEDYSLIVDKFNKLIKSKNSAIVIPTYQGKRGNPVCFSSNYKEQILNHPNRKGCKGIIRKNSKYVYEFEMQNAGIVHDIDTPSDYQDI